MADLKIRVSKGPESAPDTTVTVPRSVLKIASKLIPKRAVKALWERPIDLARISHDVLCVAVRASGSAAIQSHGPPGRISRDRSRNKGHIPRDHIHIRRLA